MVGAAEGDEIAGKIAHGVQAGVGVARLTNEFADGHLVANSAPGGKLCGEGGIGIAGSRHLAEFGGHILGFAAKDPVAEAKFAPQGKILLGDGLVLEFGGQEGLHFRLGVEPGEQARSRFVALHAAIDLLAKIRREPSDFTPGYGVHSALCLINLD